MLTSLAMSLVDVHPPDQYWAPWLCLWLMSTHMINVELSGYVSGWCPPTWTMLSSLAMSLVDVHPPDQRWALWLCLWLMFTHLINVELPGYVSGYCPPTWSMLSSLAMSLVDVHPPDQCWAPWLCRTTGGRAPALHTSGWCPPTCRGRWKVPHPPASTVESSVSDPANIIIRIRFQIPSWNRAYFWPPGTGFTSIKNF